MRSFFFTRDDEGKSHFNTSRVVSVAVGAAVIGAGVWLASRVHVARPSEYVIKTGVGYANTVSVSKWTVRYVCETTRLEG